MGFFSRKEKKPAATSITTSKSNGSIASGNSSLKSPSTTIYTGRMPTNGQQNNRVSAGTTASSVQTGPGTPLTPFSPISTYSNGNMTSPNMPQIDLPKPPDPQLDPAGYLRSLGSVRERCSVITTKAMRNDLKHFDVDMTKFPDVVTFVAKIIKVRLCPALLFYTRCSLCL
jgi:hypothetical protein